MRASTAGATGIVAGAAIAAAVYAAVLGLEFVGTVTEFFNNGETVYTDRGWHSELPDGSTLDFVTGTAGTHTYQLDVVVDGVPAVVVLDSAMAMGTPTASMEIKPTDVDLGTTSRATCTLYFDPVSFAGQTIKPQNSIAPETYRAEYALTPDFANPSFVALDDSTSWALALDGSLTWYFRFAARDDSTKQWRSPSPTLQIGGIAPPPPPPPTGGNLTGATWTGDYTINYAFADSVAVLTAAEITIEVDGQPIDTSATPVQQSPTSWRQWLGNGARVPGAWLAIVQGDSLAWVEQ